MNKCDHESLWVKDGSGLVYEITIGPQFRICSQFFHEKFKTCFTSQDIKHPKWCTFNIKDHYLTSGVRVYLVCA